MAKTVTLFCVLDDGTTPAVGPAPAPTQANGTVVQASYGENLNIHLIVRNPSGRQIPATSQRVVTFGVRDKPLPFGQLMFQHVAVVSPVGDGGWDLSIVPNDYRLMVNGSGRFVVDVWLTDNTLNPPQSNPVQPLAAFLVLPSAIKVTDPSTAPVPALVVAYGLPTIAGTSGAFLQSLGVSGGAATLQWQSALPYAAGTPTSWTGAAPTTIGTALDRIAAALVALGRKP